MSTFETIKLHNKNHSVELVVKVQLTKDVVQWVLGAHVKSYLIKLYTDSAVYKLWLLLSPRQSAKCSKKKTLVNVFCVLIYFEELLLQEKQLIKKQQNGFKKYESRYLLVLG